jgi:hypothetical protein
MRIYVALGIDGADGMSHPNDAHCEHVSAGHLRGTNDFHEITKLVAAVRRTASVLAATCRRASALASTANPAR